MRPSKKFLTDWRIKRLAKVLARTHLEILGALLFVHAACCEQRSEYLDQLTVDAVTGIDGFADAMTACELAQQEPEGLWRICDVRDDIEFLIKQDAKSQLGVEERKRKRENKQQPAGQPQGHPRVDPAVNPASDLRSEDLDLRSENQKACGEPAVPGGASVDLAIAELEAVRVQLALILGVDEVPAIRPKHRIALLDALEKSGAAAEDVTRAAANLYRYARDRRQLEAAGVDELCRLLLAGGRKDPRRAPELRVVRDDEQIAEAST